MELGEQEATLNKPQRCFRLVYVLYKYPPKKALQSDMSTLAEFIPFLSSKASSTQERPSMSILVTTLFYVLFSSHASFCNQVVVKVREE